MPELPEVESIRRQLEASVPGRTVVTAGGHPSAKFAEADRVIGGRFLAIRRRGKYLIAPTDDGHELIIHLGMTGTLGLSRLPPTDLTQHGRLPWRRAWWSLDDGRTLELNDQRRFGRVAVTQAGQYDRLPTLAALGPEPLGPEFTARRFFGDLSRHRTRIKTSLLGQRVVAGIGNIYADEALWRARINPVVRSIGPQRAERLHTAIVDVLGEAVDHGGTRLRDYRTPAGDTGAHQWHLDCYGRAGRPCNRCGSVLRRRVVDGRGTTWCGVCQRR